MPIAVFAMLVFGICCLLGASLVEIVMRNFAGEAGVPTWVFIIVPGVLSMFFSLLLYRKAASEVAGIRQSLSRALTVALLTWLAVSVYISALWCPGYRAVSCARDVLLVTTVVGGGPLLLATLIAGTIVGLVLKRRVDWLSYKGAARKLVE
ncbi:MAG: hypothetical protein ACXW16_08775 [Burkholderiaceae bacterium]